MCFVKFIKTQIKLFYSLVFCCIGMDGNRVYISYREMSTKHFLNHFQNCEHSVNQKSEYNRLLTNRSSFDRCLVLFCVLFVLVGRCIYKNI